MTKVQVYRDINPGTTGVLVRAGATALKGYYFSNNATSVRYLKIYNKATAGASTDTPIMTFLLTANPAGGGSGANISLGDNYIECPLGLSYRVTTGVADNDTGAPSANDVILNLMYF